MRNNTKKIRKKMKITCNAITQRNCRGKFYVHFPFFLWIGNLKIYLLLNLIYIKTIFSHSKIFYNLTAMTGSKSSLGRSFDAHKPSPA